MQPKHWKGILCVVIPFFLVTLVLYRFCPFFADIFLRFITALGTLSAVFFAIYGDFLREWFYPVKLSIEILKREESDQKSYTTSEYPVLKKFYPHHLRVRNLTFKKKVENCRVWLKRMSVVNVNDDNRIEEPIIFGVPRMMSWAPNEYSPDMRTFITSQVFDLGKTIEDRFEFIIYERQVDAINQLSDIRDKFKEGSIIKCMFFVTADNYHEETDFCFQITVGNISHNISHNVSVIVAITDKDQFPRSLNANDEFSQRS